MHPGKFAGKIIEMVSSELRKYGSEKPKAVTVRAGKKYLTTPEVIKIHYAALTKNTRLEGIVLYLKEEEMSVYCLHCYQTGAVVDPNVLCCPFCYSTDIKVTSGDQITIEFNEGPQ